MRSFGKGDGSPFSNYGGYGNGGSNGNGGGGKYLSDGHFSHRGKGDGSRYGKGGYRGGYRGGYGKGGQCSSHAIDGRNGGGSSGGKGDTKGGSKGGGKGAGGKPFWRQFVDPSDDPDVIDWCRETITAFLASGEMQREVTALSTASRNTLRHLAPQLGCGWVKVSKGVYALVRLAQQSSTEDAVTLRQLVDAVKATARASGGKCTASAAFRQLSAELVAFLQASLRLRSLKELPLSASAAAELRAQGVRLNARGNGFLLEGVDDDDSWHVHLEPHRLAAARAAIDAVLCTLPPPPRPHHPSRHGRHASGFLHGYATAASAREVERERASAGYQQLLPQRARLPAFQMGAEICTTLHSHAVTLVVGATGCGKTTQLPQLIYEDCAARGEVCKVVASQPRRISAVSVAERVATERGGVVGGVVGFKIRFEDAVSPTSRLVFCTVGILLKTLQSNPTLSGASHIIVDEVHERDLHTDFLLLLVKNLLAARPGLKVLLMSASVDPTVFASYFASSSTSIATVLIPGKTNYPIDELFLEDFLPRLPPAPHHQRPPWASGGSRRSGPASSVGLGVGPLQGLPVVAQDVAALLPDADVATCEALAAAHAAKGEAVDLELLCRVVVHIHRHGGEGAVLCFVPGWFEIAEGLKLLKASQIGSELEVFPLHSRMPTAEQHAIFLAPPAGKRKVILSTSLAETSITVEDVVFVVDTGRTKTTFVNEQSLVSALRTCFYSKASGLQRRGRAGRCRPGVWYRLYSSFMWAAMDEYTQPEMVRSPLEELCLEVVSLGLGSPADFLCQTISPPRPEAVQHAMELLLRIGAVEDGVRLTPLGEKLSKLQVHPMLGKMLLLGGLFRCVQPVLSVCAALGYRTPFLCPLGKEAEANAAKRLLAGGTESDHTALVAALDGWQREGYRFASRYFLSPNTLDFISRLRSDLSDGARELLVRLPSDHSEPRYLADALSATLVAGLFPNVAWLRRFGKGETCQGLKVVAHPGSVNSRSSNALVVFYEIQETTDRYLYDTTRVQMAPLLLFAQDLPVVRRTGTRTTFRLAGWSVAVDAAAADELLALRTSLHVFIQRSVGVPPTEAHLVATEALSRVFSEHAPVSPAPGVLEEDEEGDEAEPGAKGNDGIDVERAAGARPASSGTGAGKRSWEEDGQELARPQAPQSLPAGGGHCLMCGGAAVRDDLCYFCHESCM